MNDAEIQAVAETVLREKLQAFGLSAVGVRAGTDHEGLPALFVDAILVPKAPLVGGEAWNEAVGALSDRLLEKGERRFPYVTLRHPDDDRASDEPQSAALATP